jgi:hypothetical protein
MSASRPKFNFKQTILIIMIIGFVFMMMDLNARLSALFRLSGQRDQVTTEVAQLTATQAEIQRQIDFASSDAAVGPWARLEHMAQPGDKLIVPLPGSQATPEPKKQTVTTPETAFPWQVWRELFFGE